MAGSTSVPAIQFTPTGIVLPTDDQIYSGTIADMNAAFGGNLNPDKSTPQGQLATSQSAIISAKNAEIANFINQIDPTTADGFMQDAIGRIYFINRRPASPTVVQVKCSGLAGVSIPTGSLVRDSNSNVYICTGGGVIDSTGSVTLPFANQTYGPIPCPAGAISGAPYRAVIGWDRATNLALGVLGNDVESRSEFEFRRQQSVAKNAKGSLPAIYASVFDLPGVIDVYAVENVQDATVNFGVTNYPVVAHSIYVAVVGGDATAIATAIWSRKDTGSNYNGTTQVNVQDASGYSNPIPTYAVKFQRPTDTPIHFAITAQNLGSQSNTTVAAAIKAAVISAFVGQDGGNRARIGSTVFASRFFSAVASAGQLAILSVTVGKTVSPVAVSVALGVDQSPSIDPNNIVITWTS